MWNVFCVFCTFEPHMIWSDMRGLTAGAILTKMDGDSRGGAALSVKAISGKPIKFVGTGEKLEALEPFYPDRTASRILGAIFCLPVCDTFLARFFKLTMKGCCH